VVKRPGTKWGFSVLLKDTSDTCNYGESVDQTGYLEVTRRSLSPMGYSQPQRKREFQQCTVHYEHFVFDRGIDFLIECV